MLIGCSQRQIESYFIPVSAAGSEICVGKGCLVREVVQVKIEIIGL